VSVKIGGRERYILGECAKGRSLCFTEDGEDAFLSGHPREWLPDEDHMIVKSLITSGMVACDPEPQHWTDANVFDITPAGHAALSDGGADG
jgi:hypothetical protein